MRLEGGEERALRLSEAQRKRRESGRCDQSVVASRDSGKKSTRRKVVNRVQGELSDYTVYASATLEWCRHLDSFTEEIDIAVMNYLSSIALLVYHCLS